MGRNSHPKQQERQKRRTLQASFCHDSITPYVAFWRVVRHTCPASFLKSSYVKTLYAAGAAKVKPHSTGPAARAIFAMARWKLAQHRDEALAPAHRSSG